MTRKHDKLRIVVVGDYADRRLSLERSLASEGHSVVASLDPDADLGFAAEQHRPDLICVSVEAADRDVLAAVAAQCLRHPLPVLMFTARSDEATTRRALESGVSAYIVDGLHPKRLQALLQVAMARFDLYQHLRDELDQARTRLADTRDIEKAKGLVMQQQKLDEASAYGVLRRLAMERKKRIGDLAREMLQAAEMLEDVSQIGRSGKHGRPAG